MPANIISDVTFRDPAAVDAYRSRAATSIAKYGGRYLVSGVNVEPLEGSWSPSTLVIVEFPTPSVPARGTAPRSILKLSGSATRR